VVTLALAGDTNAIVKNGGWINADWQKRLPHNSTPYASTIVFAVREGNPKKIKDWDDLIRADVKVITPNPKTSGGARWNYLAAWEFAKRKYLYSEEGQDIAGKNFYRPVISEKAKAKYAKQFQPLKLFTIEEAFGGWEKADKDHFADGASFDQIYTKK
jgi:ABC-type sulfate transport system substrate-binding protein